MRFARPSSLVSIALAAAALLVAGAPAVDASGAKRTYEDKQRGFRVSLDEKYDQVPPKLTNDESYLVGDWYVDAAKFKGGGAPEFQIMWFATPKASTVTPSGDAKAPKPPAPPQTPEEIEKLKREAERPKSFDQVLDKFFGRAGGSFGGPPAAKDLWKTPQKSSTKTSGVELLWTEVNDPDDRKKDKKRGGRGEWYAFLAKLSLDRPGETIEVGFMGLAPWEFVKDGKKTFLDIAKSFEDLAKIATDSRNLGAQTELDPTDREGFRKAVHKKVIKGWSFIDTTNYCVIYDDEVDPGLAKRVGEQLESIRAQVYEVLFPADKPIAAISVVRVCKDQEQYFAYGGPRGSAGYWYPPGMELVFYEMDKRKRGDSLRVLYHEGFHQYIHYSVGDFDPHTWFNEGDGDYFFGFNYENGKWVRGTNTWRKDLAKKAKREHKFPELWEWLHWSHHDYYGGNKSGVSIGENYALGWNFVYFLRTTKKKEYAGILDKYFVTLKGYVTHARDVLEAEEKARREAPPPAAPPAAPGDGTKPPGGDGAPPAIPPVDPPPTPPVTPPEVPPAVPPGPPDAPPEQPAPPPVPPGPSDEPPEVPPGPPDAPPPEEPPRPADPDKPADPPKPAEPPKPADPAAPSPPTPQPPADPAKPADPSKPAEPAKPADPAKPPVATKPPEPPKAKRDPMLYNKQLWLDKALEEAFKGVDMKQLEKDWLNSD